MMVQSLSVFLIVAALNFVPVPVAADTIVPGALAAVDGNSENVAPFQASANGLRYQQVYAAGEFGPAAIWIDAILFRPESGFAGGDAFTKSFLRVQVDLSTTSAAPDGLSATLAGNLGADNTTVRSGPVTLSSLDAAGPGDTRAFDILIPFSTSFLYDPTLGNLLLDIRVSPSLGNATIFDATNSSGDSVSRAIGAAENATSASIRDSFGLVTKFRTHAVSAVPDSASSLPLFVMGIASLCAARKLLIPQRHRWIHAQRAHGRQ